MLRALAALLLIGCSFHRGAPPALGGGDGGTIDGAHDSAIDTPRDAFDPACFGRGGFYFCLSAPPGAIYAPTSGTGIDTGTATSNACENNTPPGEKVMLASNPPVTACAFAGTTVALHALALTGDLPAIFASADALTINGVVDASSDISTSEGPGGNTAPCNQPGIDGAPQNGGAGGGGGAGGSFGTLGGNGGASATAGVASGAVTGPVEALRAGCPGGNGGAGDNGSAVRGLGGGAIFIVARGLVTIGGAGGINASGAAGNGGLQDGGGGGGGGAGGMIVFDVGSFTAAGNPALFANGGGGGGGADNSGDGGSGGQSSGPSSVGAGATFAVTGGDGAAATQPATAGMSAVTAGGGGGGGLGVLRILSGQTLPPQVVASPPPS